MCLFVLYVFTIIDENMSVASMSTFETQNVPLCLHFETHSYKMCINILKNTSYSYNIVEKQVFFFFFF